MQSVGQVLQSSSASQVPLLLQSCPRQTETENATPTLATTLRIPFTDMSSPPTTHQDSTSERFGKCTARRCGVKLTQYYFNVPISQRWTDQVAACLDLACVREPAPRTTVAAMARSTARVRSLRLIGWLAMSPILLRARCRRGNCRSRSPRGGVWCGRAYSRCGCARRSDR